MDENLLKLLELVEKDKVPLQPLRQCSYEILQNFKVRRYKDGRLVLKQGEIHNTSYTVASGYADIYVEPEHGKKYLLCIYIKGDCIGELELFSQAGYISRVKARGDVVMLELDRTHFAKWIRMDNNFSEYMIRTLCSNSYRMRLGMGQNILYMLKQRACQYLVGNAGADGKLRFVVLSEILSQKTAVIQRSMNHTLKQLREQGFIELNKGNTVIKDYDALNRERNQEE